MDGGYGTSGCRQQAYRGALIEQAAQNVTPGSWLLALGRLAPEFAIRNQSRCSLALALNDGDLFRREVVDVIDQIVDLPVECGAFVW